MSLPSSFTIFSPSFSLYKLITPEEYLAQSQKYLEQLPKWKEVALGIAIISFTTSIFSAAVAVIMEDEAKSDDEQGKGYKIAMGCAMTSLVTLFIALAAYPTISYGIQPLLEKRIDWLQTALSS